MMTKSNALRTAAVATMLGLLVIFALALSTARSKARQSGIARTLASKEPVTYFIADGGRSTGFRPGDSELALWAFQAWQRSAGGGLRFQPASESDALIRLYWAEPGGGEYGETQPLLVRGRRGAAVFIRPDVESLGPDIARRAAADDLLRHTIVYLTCLHELGHALGVPRAEFFSPKKNKPRLNPPPPPSKCHTRPISLRVPRGQLRCPPALGFFVKYPPLALPAINVTQGICGDAFDTGVVVTVG